MHPINYNASIEQIEAEININDLLTLVQEC